MVRRDLERVLVTPQQEIFIKVYTTPGDTFCNGTYSYAVAYDYELPRKPNGDVDITSGEYLSCKANSSRLMLNVNIRDMIRGELLEQFNEKTADAKVSEIMQRGRDTDALQAVRIFNELKNRVTKKVDVTVAARPLAALTDEELKTMAND